MQFYFESYGGTYEEIYMKDLLLKWRKHIILGIILIGIIIPVVLTWLVHADNIFSWIPGDDTEWFGFWASYMGVFASIAIAWFTWINQEELRKINQESENLKDAVNRSIVGVNLRLSAVEMRPGVSDAKAAYHMTFRFDNKANALLDDMKLKKLTFKSGKNNDANKFERENPNFKYILQNNTPILDGEVTVASASDEEKLLTNFYFYYSQFLPDSRDLEIELCIKIKIDSEEDVYKKMTAKLGKH